MLARLRFHGLRSAERLLPPGLLAFVAWPAVAVFALGRSIFGVGRTWRRNVALAFGTPPGFLPTWRHFIGETYVRLAMLWPDRFRDAAWRRRFTVTGLEALMACHTEGTPVVLAVIHAQHLGLLRLFLRAHGLPVASLVYAPVTSITQQLCNAAADKGSPLAGGPQKFPLARLRSAYAFLRSGRCLLVACDVPTSDAIALPTAIGTIRINVGPFRCAALADAHVVPAVAWQERPWRFHLSFGEPVPPPSHSADLDAFTPLAEHCLATWRPLLLKHPEQHNVVPGAWNRPPQDAAATRSS